jgi:UDP-glucose 4-epimerase
LSQAGTPVVVVDNLSTGLDSRVLGLPTTNLELSDASAVPALEQLITKNEISSVVHLAALKQVGESVEKPEEYFTKISVGRLILAAVASSRVQA